jgi:endonuclease/exonuclease/phosphatase family metal-dependent hydrolase
MINEEGNSIRLMTYNVGGGRKDFGSNLVEVLQIVSELQPDILGLQEITELQDMDDRWYRWDEAIADRMIFKTHSFFGPTLSMREQFHVDKTLFVNGIFHDWLEWRQGNALISRWEFVRLGSTNKPGQPLNLPIFRPPTYEGNRDTDPRYTILSRIDLGSVQPFILVTHLTTLLGEKGAGEVPGKSEQAQIIRQRQCRQLFDLLDEHALKKGELVFILADFNAEAKEACISSTLIEGAGFVRLKPDFEIGTHPKVSTPIDHILAHAGAHRVEYRCRVIDSPLAWQASDHLPVVADLKVFSEQSDRVKRMGAGVYEESE